MEAAPFTLTPSSDLANLNRRHRAVFERIVQGLNQRQSIVALLGEAGLGKMALLRYALENNSDPKYKIISIDVSNINPQGSVSFENVVKAVYQKIGYELKYQSSLDILMDLHDIFIEEKEKDSHLVIMIEQAHLLPNSVLNSLPKLIDVYPYQEPLAQLVLVGDPELNKTLQHATLQQLKNRLQLIETLVAFNHQESLAYIQHKLDAASPTGEAKVLSNAAMRRLAKAANGIPRTLNMLCTDALVAGYAERARPISARVVKQVLSDFPARRSPWAARLAWLGMVVMLLAALAAGLTFRDALPSPLPLAAPLRPILASLKQQTAAWLTPAPHADAPPSRPAQPPVATAPQTPSEAPPVELTQTPPPSPASAAPSAPALRPLPEAAPAEAGVETPSSPVERAMQRVAALIDQHFPQGGAFGLKVWSNKAPGETYVEGEPLILYVMAEAPAFLWIDYYQADGQIVPLLPHPLISNQAQAGQRFTLGGAGSAFQFTVAPPFGAEMLTVVASPTPIDAAAGAAADASGDLDLDRLSRRLQTYGSQGKAAAAYVRIRTQREGAARP